MASEVEVLRASAEELQELYAERLKTAFYRGRPTLEKQDRAELSKRWRLLNEAKERRDRGDH